MVFRREICGKRGGMVYGEGEMQYRVRIEFTFPKLVSLDTPHEPITKFLKNVRKKSVSLLSDFPKDLIYIPCGISQDRIVRLPSLNALHNKKGR